MGFLSRFNPLPGIAGGLTPEQQRVGNLLQTGQLFRFGQGGGLLEKVSPPTSFKDVRRDASQAVNAAQKVGQQLAGIPARIGKATGNDTLAKWGNSASKLERGIVDDASANTRLAVNTTNLNNGILEKRNRAEITRQNPALHAKLQAIGTAVGSTGIPIASQIGMGVAAISAARRREAGLLNNRQFGASLAGTALGAFGPNLGGGWQGAALRGGAGGAIGAYGSGRPILEGALTGAAAGGAGAYLTGVGQQYGVNPALTKAGTGAVVGGIRGGSEGAYSGAVTGLASGVGGELGGRYGAQAGGLLANNYLAGERAESQRNQALSAMQQRQQQFAQQRQLPAQPPRQMPPMALQALPNYGPMFGPPAINQQLPFAQRYWQRG